MLKLFMLFLLISGWFPDLFALEGTLVGRDVLSSVQKKYSASPDFRADFLQVIHYTGLNRKGRSSGTILFKKPNKLVWMQKTPERSSYISNGKVMWLYIPDDEQVFLNRDVQETVDRIGLLFMSAKKELISRFKISIVEAKQSSGKKKKFLKKNIASVVSGSRVTFEFLPVKKDSFSRALLRVNIGKNLITRVTIYDLARNKTEINLTNIHFKVGARNSDFEFTPPAHIEVHEAGS